MQNQLILSPEVAAALDNPEVSDARFFKSSCGEHAAKATANNRDIDFCGDGFAQDARLDVGVFYEALEVTGDFLILRVAIRTQALVALGQIARS